MPWGYLLGYACFLLAAVLFVVAMVR